MKKEEFIQKLIDLKNEAYKNDFLPATSVLCTLIGSMYDDSALKLCLITGQYSQSQLNNQPKFPTSLQ